MRYPAEHKAEVHRMIVNDASRRLRSEGLTGAAVSAVMHDTGLTHGGFYKHFHSKDDLLLESLAAAFREFGDRLVHAAEHARRGAAWKAIINTYLSPEYCDHVEHGCPLTALAPELARAGKPMRARILNELKSYKDRMTPFMPGRTVADKERAFFIIFPMMIGTVALARNLPDPTLRARVLSGARDFLLRSF